MIAYNMRKYITNDYSIDLRDNLFACVCPFVFFFIIVR